MSNLVVRNSRSFDLSDILSVSTGRLVSKRGMDAIYDILGFLTNDPGITTIGLLAVAKETKAEVLKQHPALAEIDPSTLDAWLNTTSNKEDAVRLWVDSLRPQYGDSLELTPMSEAEPRDLVDDLETLMGIRGNLDNVIVVDAND